MSQERLTKMKCTVCKKIGYFTFKSKEAAKEKLELNKFCKFCRKHTPHKESK
ncbi:MAG: 50S ribosomal protein L33 [bacterium]|nr:50S ribosomal protein L33 [bacterium]